MASERVLLIDDDRTVLAYLRGVFAKEGFTVFTALDALQGPMVARQARPDLVVLDLSMPGGGGSAVLSRLRLIQTTSQVPVLVYSGLPRENVDQLVPEAADVRFVPKPSTPDDLMAAARSLLAH